MKSKAWDAKEETTYKGVYGFAHCLSVEIFHSFTRILWFFHCLLMGLLLSSLKSSVHDNSCPIYLGYGI